MAESLNTTVLPRKSALLFICAIGARTTADLNTADMFSNTEEHRGAEYARIEPSDKHSAYQDSASKIQRLVTGLNRR